MASRWSDTKPQVDRARERAQPLTGSASFGPLLERIGDARYVLLGEASTAVPITTAGGRS